MATASHSEVIPITQEEGYGSKAARAIDAAIAKLSANHDVLSVAVTPITTGYSSAGPFGPIGMSGTVCLIVTVVWREP
jgi:hypothetical protein